MKPEQNEEFDKTVKHRPRKKSPDLLELGSGLNTVRSSFNYFTNAAATRQPLPGMLPESWGDRALDSNQNGYLDGDEMVNVRTVIEGTSLQVFLNDLQYGPTFNLSLDSAAMNQSNGVGLQKNRLGSSGGFLNQVVSNILLDNLDVFFFAPMTGDFDGDGDVDGRDFLAWQRGVSPNSLSEGDLAVWQQAFGPSPMNSITALPGPACLILSCVACTAVLLHR